MCLYPCGSLNNEKNCHEIGQNKIAVCEQTAGPLSEQTAGPLSEKTAGPLSGNSSDMNSPCLKVLIPVEIFQI